MYIFPLILYHLSVIGGAKTIPLQITLEMPRSDGPQIHLLPTSSKWGSRDARSGEPLDR